MIHQCSVDDLFKISSVLVEHHKAEHMPLSLVTSAV